MTPLPSTIRLFPLSEVVLFPDTLLPLHIFEPRYRALVRDALTSDGLIGLIVPKSTGQARPELFDVGCAGRIVKHNPLPDGRSLIVLRGLTRFRVREEVSSATPYRVVEVQTLYDAPVPADRMRRWRDELKQALAGYSEAVRGRRQTLDRTFARSPFERVLNMLCASLPLTTIEKQSLLECSTIERRHQLLCDLLAFKTAERKLGMVASRDADA